MILVCTQNRDLPICLNQLRVLISDSNGHIELPQNLKWIKANLGGGGYYRVQYPPEVTKLAFPHPVLVTCHLLLVTCYYRVQYPPEVTKLVTCYLSLVTCYLLLGSNILVTNSKLRCGQR